MKKLLILMALFTSTVNAEEIPRYLKDGEIIVKLKNGKTYTYSTNEYKVVKRGNPVLSGATPVTVSESSKKGVESENQEKKGRKNEDGTYNLKGLKNRREDPFGVSVLSIQLSKRGSSHKIINRYITR